jgi:hypothetical protein
MAYPSSFDESNHVLSRPMSMTDEECVPLSVLQTETEDGHPVTVSCWKLTEEELQEINRTGRVWLMVCGDSIPPVAVCGQKPFKSS